MATNDGEQNRSSALSPEQLAMVTALVSAAVKEAMSASASTFAAAIKESKVPYEDPAVARRKLREQMKFRDDEKAEARQKELAIANCTHYDKQSKESLNLNHNFPDRQPRGVCVLCNGIIHPPEWRIASSPEEAVKTFMALPEEQRAKLQPPRGTAYMVPEHPQYHRVRQLERMTS